MFISSLKQVSSVIFGHFLSPTIDAQKLCKLSGDVTSCFLVAANSDSSLWGVDDSAWVTHIEGGALGYVTASSRSLFAAQFGYSWEDKGRESSLANLEVSGVSSYEALRSLSFGGWQFNLRLTKRRLRAALTVFQVLWQNSRRWEREQLAAGGGAR